ncbi:MAG: radical SAM family heme chaperone HemW [Bacteroidetes bacterium]|nr:radical SAM family heme chaperone HemW [Bacteroidota bacterium]HET6245630.1 radical SAM family heme chaperone HemW [Bacteroidia bacterium]
MAGLYIHIPFCKQACNYCDFHFSTTLKHKDDFLKALIKEIAMQKLFFGENKNQLNTVYFGGGTPSLLSEHEINSIFDAIENNFTVASNAEITLEANPDDLTREKLRQFNATPINRLSIGIQSFRNDDLKFMNRAHSSQMALTCVKDAIDLGFHNISIDLIYGIPGLSIQNWIENLHQAFAMNVQHISAYCLTVEPKTPLDNFIKKGKISSPDEELAAQHFETMVDEMEQNGFIQYEISNFCKKGYQSRHNSNYWTGEKYLGLGPSAHSFNGEYRQWNINKNGVYIKAINEDKIPFEKEVLTRNKRFNEYVLTSLRTREGADLNVIQNKFGQEYSNHCLKENTKHLSREHTTFLENKICLTQTGKLFADAIASGFFIIED